MLESVGICWNLVIFTIEFYWHQYGQYDTFSFFSFPQISHQKLVFGFYKYRVLKIETLSFHYIIVVRELV